jgi:hypothetical protein
MTVGIRANYFNASQYARANQTGLSVSSGSVASAVKKDTYTRSNANVAESQYIVAFSDLLKKSRDIENDSVLSKEQSEFGELTAEQRAELRNKYNLEGDISFVDSPAFLSDLVDMNVISARHATMALGEYAPSVDGIMVQRVFTLPEYDFRSGRLLDMLGRSIRNMQSLLDTNPTYLSGEQVKINSELAEEYISVQEKIRDLIADIKKG